MLGVMIVSKSAALNRKRTLLFFSDNECISAIGKTRFSIKAEKVTEI